MVYSELPDTTSPPRVSVIVPVYNAQNTLQRCIESICNQTIQDLELILVDDGSSDSSHFICLEASKKDRRIRVIHKENNGVSSARNAGLDAAQGTYLLFCDSDDTVEPNWAEVLLNNSSPECVGMCGYYTESSHQLRVYGFDENRVISSADFLDIGYGVLLGSVCNKCFYRQTIQRNRLYFDETTSFEEDVIFVVRYFSFCEEIHVSNQNLYHYFDTPGSLIHSAQSIPLSLILRVYNLIEDTILQNGGNFAKYEAKHYQAIFSSMERRITDRESAKNIVCNKQFQKAIRYADLSKYDKKYLFLLKTKAIPLIMKLKRE